MTFLELCQRTASEADVGSANQTVLPIAVVGQQGELKRIVQYVQDAWRETQGRRLWSWMWEKVTITIPAGQSCTVASTGVAADRWVKQNTYVPTLTSDSAGRFMDYVPWMDFQRMYPRMLAGSSLGVWTIAPDNRFWVNGIAPSAGFTCQAERYANPTALRAKDDVPGMPDDLHMLLVYKAMRKFAGFDEAGTQRSIALDEERDMWQDLLNRCLPAMTLGGSLLDQL